MNKNPEHLLKMILSGVLSTTQDEIQEYIDRNIYNFWDSIKHLNIIFAIEDEFDIRFDEKEIVENRNFLQLLHLIEQKLGSR